MESCCIPPQPVEEQKPVSIQVTFSMPPLGIHNPTVVETFDSTNTPPVHLGSTTSTTSAESLTGISTVTSVPPGSVVYSGRHDHGPLPAPREGGPYASLIGCVLAAKDFSNNYLTEVMKQEKTRKNNPHNNEEGAGTNKRSKTSSI